MSFIAMLKAFFKGFLRAHILKSEVIFIKHQNPKVSIVLPVYNQADYIEQSIDSVLSQTYRNIELIIINDGSTDGTEQKLLKYSNVNNVILYSQENKKLPAALNKGFELATGDYFTWTSADNIMLPTQIEVLLNYLQCNLDKGFVYSNYQLIDENGEPLREIVRGYQSAEDLSKVILPDIVTEENFHDSGVNFIGASFLYRMEAAVIVGDYAEDLYAGEDYDYFLRLHTLFKFGHVSDNLYKYRVHGNTITAMYRDCINGKCNNTLGLALLDNIRNVSVRDKKLRESLNKDLHVVPQGKFNRFDASSEKMTVKIYSSKEVAHGKLYCYNAKQLLHVLVIGDNDNIEKLPPCNYIDLIVSKKRAIKEVNGIRIVSGIGCISLTPAIYKYWLFNKYSFM